MRLAVNPPATVADREGISDGNLWGRPGQSRMIKINFVDVTIILTVIRK